MPSVFGALIRTGDAAGMIILFFLKILIFEVTFAFCLIGDAAKEKMKCGKENRIFLVDALIF